MPDISINRGSEDLDSRPKVLLVDGDALLLWSIVETLPRADYAVTAVSDARHAVLAVAEADYDVVVVADRLPDFDGLTLVAALRSLAPQARVLVLAMDATRELVDAAFSLGAAAVMEKPLALSELEPAIARAADHSTSAALVPEARPSDARSRYTHSRYGVFHDSRRRR